MRTGLGLLLLTSAAVASAAGPFNAQRLTAREWDNLRATLTQVVGTDAVVQQMIAICPKDASNRLLKYYDRRGTDDSFTYYRDLFDGQLARADFDQVWKAGSAAKIDCSPATIARAVEQFEPGKLQSSPAYAMGFYRFEAKERPVTFLPATDAEALSRLRDIVGRYTFEARGPNNSWALSRRFFNVIHKDCTTTFSGGVTLASSTGSAPESFIIDWKKGTGVAAFQQGDVSGVQIDGPWSDLGDVRAFIDTTDASRARGMTGPLERLRLSCAKP